MKHKNLFPILSLYLFVAGCSSHPPQTVVNTEDPHVLTHAENNLFLQQNTFDPWVLSTTDPAHVLPAYVAGDGFGQVTGSDGKSGTQYKSGEYDSNGVIMSFPLSIAPGKIPANGYAQTLNLKTGVLQTTSQNTNSSTLPSRFSWQKFWNSSDIVISGDPEAQQVTHAELFYLCGSTAKGLQNSIPPMGLSSNVYDGHIFWDAEIWMMPALLPQHPDLARTIVDYRFHRLSAAEALARQHGFVGAEYPWESARTGLEEAPEEFSHERHVTADVAYAAWQYYLWTGDTAYLRKEAWPILSETAKYWTSRVTTGDDGKYHINGVVGPDETAGLVNDDAWTNGIVQYNLNAAVQAAGILGVNPDSRWSAIARKLFLPYDSKASSYYEYGGANDRLQAKQADTQMLVYPLGLPMTSAVAGNTLQYALKHTIIYGPAMTSSINAVIAARLGETQQSLDLYHDSYRPFMRGPWDAFSEKRTKSDVYFCTGMGGNLQVLLYGFAGLNVVHGSQAGEGTLIARSGDAALYANPHLPPGWTSMTLMCVKFREVTVDLTIGQGNNISRRVID